MSRLFDNTRTTSATINKVEVGHSRGLCQVVFSYNKGET
jgi:hypothetical protein